MRIDTVQTGQTQRFLIQYSNYGACSWRCGQNRIVQNPYGEEVWLRERGRMLNTSLLPHHLKCVHFNALNIYSVLPAFAAVE